MSRLPRLLLALVLSAGLLPLPAYAATSDSPPAAPGPARDRFFGMAEAFRDLPMATSAGAAWERLVFSWQYIQPESPENWNGGYFPSPEMDALDAAGFQVVGLVQDTPEWARANPDDGATSVPAGLDLAWDDPENAWGQFMYRIAEQYRGRIDRWIIWNEPEFRPTDQGGLYLTFSGNDQDYARLLAVAYQAAKAANPDAVIVFGATSYWIDRVNGRRQLLDRVLEILSLSPEALENGGYFDAVALNIYWAPDDIRRVGLEYRELMARYGFGEKKLWITETNSMPYDDPVEPKPYNGQRVTLEEQADFVIPAFATALATGYERVAWHAAIDRDTVDEIWGLARNDGTLRPAHAAYKTASTWLSNAVWAEWMPVERPAWRWQSDGDYSNVAVYQVVVQRPGNQRVSVLWNGDGVERTVFLPRSAQRARVLDRDGRATPAVLDGAADAWRIVLPAATAHSPNDPDGYYYTGGSPMLLVEDGVSPDAPTAGVQVPDVLAAAAR